MSNIQDAQKAQNISPSGGTVATSFSAGPHALGYLYQARVAMYLLFQCPDEAIVKIEGLDDIEITNPKEQKKLSLTQLKHHIGKPADLSDYSVDLWKSIRVWAEQATNTSYILSDARLFLLTTAKAAPNSAASKLGVKNRNPEAAETALLTVAQTSTNKALTAAFKAFNSLTPATRSVLVSSIMILDEHEDIDEYREKTQQHIRPAVHKQYVSSLYERLEGWWFNQVVQNLLEPLSTPSISAFELNEKVASIAATFHEENLPIDFLDVDPDDGFISESNTKLFVKQLEAIEVLPRSISKAILDYYRAFQQRSQWLDEGLIYPDELSRYELRLVDEWERYFDGMCGKLSAETTEKQLIELGKKLLNWAELDAIHLKLRPRIDADFIRRGSFHILADKHPTPYVSWHPKFVERLAATMKLAAITV